MKVGGNASATDFFSKNGGAAALNSKDAKVKYTSRAAIAYKDELKRRATNDARVHPDTVVANDIAPEEDKRKSEDFFESWDKPIVHKPTPPPSRTATPPVLGRTPSPANGNGTPANGKAGTTTRSTLSTEPAAPRTTTSSALRSSKAATSTGARRTGVLGAKKPQKLVVKKAETISFEDAEKAAKEEAERIEKWGADEVELKKPAPIKPTPLQVSRPPSQSSTSAQKESGGDVARLGMGMQRLGFGMVANSSKPTPGPVRSAPGISHNRSADCSRTRGNLCSQQVFQSERHLIGPILRPRCL
jgi:ADP-ribosylation factor GTPase-activating protein 2/3